MNIVDNTLEIYDSDVAKGSWCSIKIENLMNGKYYLRKNDRDWQLIRRGYRISEKEWEVFDGELGLDSGTLLFESGDTKIDVTIKERVEKTVGKKIKLVRFNEIMCLEVCRNEMGEIFGIKIFN